MAPGLFSTPLIGWPNQRFDRVALTMIAAFNFVHVGNGAVGPTGDVLATVVIPAPILLGISQSSRIFPSTVMVRVEAHSGIVTRCSACGFSVDLGDPAISVVGGRFQDVPGPRSPSQLTRR